jgi:endonuclease/exonuclease/phosphatase family metal-dependent hydrolase
LATWNLEHLAEADGTGCRPRTEADYDLLRSHARRLQADVVALQEVESARAAYRVFPADEWVVIMSDRPLSQRGGFCRGSEGATIRRQDVGFAIRKGISFKRNPDIAALGLGDPDLRWGIDITLNLPQPMRLLSVHLKSGCNSGRDPQDRDCGILFQQLPVLESWIDARGRAGEHFAVLGDWNRRTAMAGDEFLTTVSDDDPPGGRLVMTDAGRGATCIARYKDFIDHIAVGEQAAERVIPGSFVEYSYGGVEEQNYPSDHCPISIQLR